MKTFSDNCNDSDDFRLAVKRTRQRGVAAAMQEEHESSEATKCHIRRDYQQVYAVDDKHYTGIAAEG